MTNRLGVQQGGLHAAGRGATPSALAPGRWAGFGGGEARQADIVVGQGASAAGERGEVMRHRPRRWWWREHHRESIWQDDE